MSTKIRKGQWNKGCVAWNRGKKWNEMFDAETIERLKKHLRELGKRAGNRGKGFEQLWRPVIQMDEYGNRRIDNMSHISQRIIKPEITELTTCSTSVSTSLRPESQN